MPRLRQVPRAEASENVRKFYDQLFGERDPVQEPGTATGTPGNWWSVFALVPRIFDHIDLSLLPALQETLDVPSRGDFCVGDFNLRGWHGLAPYVDRWGGDGDQCRVLIRMQRLPHDELRESLSL